MGKKKKKESKNKKIKQGSMGAELMLSMMDKCRPYPVPPTPFKVPYTLEMTVAQLRAKLAEERGYEPDSFGFHLAQKVGLSLVLFCFLPSFFLLPGGVFRAR
jgi:hypothetical protein